MYGDRAEEGFCRQVGRVLQLASITLAGAAVCAAGPPSRNTLTALLWLGSVCLLAAACVRRGPASLERRGQLRKVEAVAFAAVLVGAAAARLFKLQQYPLGLHGDEGEFGSIALRLLANQIDLSLFGTDIHYQQPNGYAFLLSWVIPLFADPVEAARALSAVVGTVHLVVVYALCRSFFGPLCAVVACGLLAFAPWHLAFSRMILNDIFVLPFLTATVLLLYRAAARRDRNAWACAGLTFGFGMLADFNSKSVILALVTFSSVAYLLLIRRYREQVTPRHLVAFAISALVVLAPLLATNAKDGRLHVLGGSYDDTSFWTNQDRAHQHYGTTTTAGALAEQVRRSVLSVVWYGDESGFNVAGRRPLFNYLTAVFFAVGLVVVAARLRDAAYGLVGVWWVVGLLPDVMANDPPEAHHLLPSITAAYIIAAIGACLVAGWCTRLRHGKWLRLLVAGLIVTVAGAINLRWFFQLRPDESDWERNVAAGRTIRAWARSCDVYFMGPPDVSSDYGSIRFVAQLAPVRDLETVAEARGVVPTRPVGFLFTEAHFADAEEIRRIHPGGEIQEWHDSTGRLMLVGYTLPSCP
jgi:4-amino-4-deoxy-L-arabinose transferase-like glycosyltransferase